VSQNAQPRISAGQASTLVCQLQCCAFVGFLAALWHSLAQARRAPLERLARAAGAAVSLGLAGGCFGGPHPVPPTDGRPVTPVGTAGSGGPAVGHGGAGGALDSGHGGAGGAAGAAGTGAAGQHAPTQDAGSAECDAGVEPTEGDVGLNCEDDGDGGFVAR
jgi:hypothetical protein